VHLALFSLKLDIAQVNVDCGSGTFGNFFGIDVTPMRDFAFHLWEGSLCLRYPPNEPPQQLAVLSLFDVEIPPARFFPYFPY